MDLASSPLRPLFPNQLTKVKKGANDPKLSVERVYQKKTQLEHILLRPDSYIGSVEPVTQQMWVYDEEIGLNCRDVAFVPGLYKIFDEILVNAADNKQRDKNMSCIKVNIDPENNTITVWNNGKGIPVVEHKVEKVFVPHLIFGQLLTSSNYNDEQKKVTGGRNGYGAKLCNIFSSKFTVETACREYKKCFKQTWKDNMGDAQEAKIKYFDGDDYTCITFQPDLPKFKMQSLDKDIVAIMSRRAYDIAGTCKGVKVFLNGKKLPVSGFRSYVDLYLSGKVDETGSPLKIIHEVANNRWEICVTMSEKGFQQISFANSIATTKGGRHVDYITDQLVHKLIEVVKKKNKGGVAIKPFQVKNHLWVFVNSSIENPTFDSQTKENMTLQAKSFGSTCVLTEKFIKAALNCGVIESIMNWVRFKAQNMLNKKCSGAKQTKIKGIPKLDDANDAGTKHSHGCTLILTEGDSAKTLAVSGLGVIGRDRYGVFPLRGKLLNVREATHKQIMENVEINNMIKILGLQYKKNYDDQESLKTLRYGKLMIMTDQDQDGSHIKGLLINFIHHNWPSLLRHKFLEEFITPIVKVSKNKQEIAFYSLPEFDEWKQNTDNNKTWKTKYYKGLGTSTAKEAKEYFTDMEKHRIPFKYNGPDDDAAITLAFSRKKIDERKEWLTNFMVNRRQRKLHGLPEQYLYGKETKHLTYNEFINKELVLFSNADNERSIPSLVDGLKPGQRKVLFTCFKRNDKREVKVAQLAGSVAEISAYHHGEVSLMMTIIGLAQNFIGSNNINLLQPIGQFGTRLNGGKDAASPRYIFTMLSTLSRLLYPAMDDNVLKYIYDDNQRVEPEWYIPIIPMVLVNGADGIGTGWACKIPNYDTREIVNNIRRLLDGDDPVPMLPNYKNFKGTIFELGTNQYIINGEISVLNATTVEISELPIKTWTQAYKEQVLEPMMNGTEKTPPLITDYKEYHTDTTVRFTVTLTEQKLAEAEAAGLHKVFKLYVPLTCNSMVLFDHVGCLKKYDTVQEILKDFFELRLKYYALRKDWLEGFLGAEYGKLSNQARFILEKIEGTLVIENKPKRELIQLLFDRGYDSDPVKCWKESQGKDPEPELGDTEEEEATVSSGSDFNYLLNMPMWYLTKEKKDDLLKQRDVKEIELKNVTKKTTSDLWKEDLAAFIEELERVEMEEKENEVAHIGKALKGKAGKGKAKRLHLETMPTPQGRRIVPRVTTAMKLDAGKKIIKKKGKDDTDSLVVKMEFDNKEENSLEHVSLAERLTKKAEPGHKTNKASQKQTTLQFKPLDKKKRNPWSDSESESGSDVEVVDLPPRDKPQRTTVSKAKYVLSSSEDDDGGISSESDDEFHISDSDSEFSAPKAKPPAKKVQSKASAKTVRSASEVLQSTKSSSKPSGESIQNDSLQTVDDLQSSGSFNEPAAVIPPQNDLAGENEVEGEPEPCESQSNITKPAAKKQVAKPLGEKPAPKKRALGKKPTAASKKVSKAKYVLSSSEDDDGGISSESDDEFHISDSDSEFLAPKAKPPAKKVQSKATVKTVRSAREVLQSTKSSSKPSGESIQNGSLQTVDELQSSGSVNEPAAVIPQQNDLTGENEVEDEPEACVSQSNITNPIAKKQVAKPLGEKPAPKKRALGKKPTAASKKDEKQPSIFDALTKKTNAPKTSKLPVSKKITVSSDEDCLPKKAATAKAKISKRKKVLDSDSEDDFGTIPVKSTAVKKSKIQDDDSFHIDNAEDSNFTDLHIAPRAGRAKKPVQYLEDSDDDDMF
ncbi:DNA topoisomerase 2-alpha isoform X1 [Amblyraja radiata]|uniref:DNA topoisomerase 2-alpha isoform X1 n=1 Tax=Amblyraja radiata TaxID=386614 RepID=UPI001401C8F6|nr:DNA topoisomerase 2-alpha isoform X1 [Amblyraja radiata]